jgi:CBS domain containing-hemolysin-like protein
VSFPMAVFVTVLLLIGSGFFVAAEFALVAAKRHRMEKAAAEGRRGAEAALSGMRAGCVSAYSTAISHELDPLLHEVGLPTAVSYGVAFAVAMVVVVFLHMVVGEMAPKSWAIAHPERSAMLLSPPFRAVVRAVRPLIRLLNALSNALVRLCRVTPRDELASVHNREQLTHLVAESERLGLISATDSQLLTRSLTEPETPVGGLRIPAAQITSVDGAASIDALLRVAADNDRTRLLVRENGAVLGSVHARDALVARARGRATSARDLARPVPELTEATTVADAIDVLRRRRSSLAVVRDPSGKLTGMVTLDDLLARLMQPSAG